jgi:hypothetical protein
VGDLDGDRRAHGRQELGVRHPDSIDGLGRSRNGPSGPSFGAVQPSGFSTLTPVAKVAHPAPTLEWDTPLFQQAATQLEHALELAEVPEMVANRLRAPERALILTLPVGMDDGIWTRRL